jgi:hypothetical protein
MHVAHEPDLALLEEGAHLESAPWALSDLIRWTMHFPEAEIATIVQGSLKIHHTQAIEVHGVLQQRRHGYS